MKEELENIVERYFEGEELENILSDYASRQYALMKHGSEASEILAVGTVDEISDFTGYKVQTLYNIKQSNKGKDLMLIRMM